MFTITQQESQVIQIHTKKYSYCGAFYYGGRHFVCKMKVHGQLLHYDELNPQILLNQLIILMFSKKQYASLLEENHEGKNNMRLSSWSIRTRKKIMPQIIIIIKK